MKNYFKFLLTFIVGFCFVLSLSAKSFEVASQQEFNNALNASLLGDEIVWLPGTYSNILMYVKKDKINIRAKILGESIFTGESRLDVSGNNVTVTGLQFLDGNIGRENVIQTTGSDNIFYQINISGYTSWKYLVIKEKSQRVKVSYCNFENRLNLDDKNILSILVNAEQPGFHKVEYCTFQNFKGKGGDMGIEPIRIGVSTQKEFSSKSVVEYCYFTQCNGDGEIVSNKAADNVFRYNTFENNPISELVLRHGDGAAVYGNFFLNGKGGVRVKEGEKHAIFNNYFSGLTDRSIELQNTKSDPVRNITIAYNTFVKTAKVRLGGSKRDYQPKRIVLANNIFFEPIKSCINNPTGSEVWNGNMYFGNLGIPEVKGVYEDNPLFEMNEFGFYQLTFRSKAINASKSEVLSIPKKLGLQVDSYVDMDIEGKPRPEAEDKKDIGCSEFQVGAKLKPLVTKDNTGPAYLRDDFKNKL